MNSETLQNIAKDLNTGNYTLVPLSIKYNMSRRDMYTICKQINSEFDTLEMNDLRDEVWRPLESYRGIPLAANYSVSNYGRIRSETYTAEDKNGKVFTKNGKIFRLRHNLDSYFQSILYTDMGQRVKAMNHRCVAEAFLSSSYAPDLHVNHIDSEPTNNHVSNLEFVTAAQNMAHAKKFGNMRRGENTHLSVLTREEVIKARNLYDNGATLRSITKILNCNDGTIYSIVSGRTWRHLPLCKRVYVSSHAEFNDQDYSDIKEAIQDNPLVPLKKLDVQLNLAIGTCAQVNIGQRGSNITLASSIAPIRGEGTLKGSRHGMAKFTDEQVSTMRTMYITKQSTTASLAKEYNCHYNVMRLIVTYKTYK